MINDYEIYENKILGEGSYSSVYLGKYIGENKKNIITDTLVAIKILKISNLEKLKERINDEIKIMNIIKKDPHPNIVGCYDVILKNEKLHIILEYCDSGNLKDIIKKPIQEKFVQYYFNQLKNGLMYLRKYNIFHRDFKPKNILLTNNKKILKIADFGFSIETNDNLLHETICGSPLYMAPEILQKNPYNDQIDIWSIGMILFEMLYGYHPFEECKTINELKNLINNNIQIPPKNNTNIKVSELCISLLNKLLQKDVKKRINWDQLFYHEWFSINNLNIEEKNKINNKNNMTLELEIIYDYIEKIDEFEKNNLDINEDIFDIEIDDGDNFKINTINLNRIE